MPTILTPDHFLVRECPNFGYPAGAAGRGGQQVMAIIDHIAQGTKAGLDAHFANPAAQVSAHFGVMKDGAIHRYVDEGSAAWGAGLLNQPDESMPWLPPPGAARGQLVNQRVISIEHEGFSGEPLTPAQFEATVALHRYLIAQWGIPVDDMHIVGHYRLDSINRKGCPGPAFPWDDLFSALRGGQEEEDNVDKERVKRALDVIWGWSERLGQLSAGQAATEIQDAVRAIKEEAGLP